ncbi:MAG: type II secretion system F family protein [Betaproteobacteria bacterium]|nr:type II secretion system F family protein [Betaproteobacteria bacterium]
MVGSARSGAQPGCSGLEPSGELVDASFGTTSRSISDRIAVDLAGRSKLLGDEFLALSLALHSGLGRAEALADMAWRCQSKSLDMLATLVAQAERLGTSMIDASKALAQSMRQQREFDAEERAGQVAVQLVVPLVLCMLPALFVVLLGPALLQVSDVLKEL